MTLLFDAEQSPAATSLNWPGVTEATYDAELRSGGGAIQIVMAGDFDSAEVFIELAQNTLDFVRLLDTNFSAPDGNRMDLAKGCRIRAVIAGGAGNGSISVDVIELAG